MIGDGTNDLLVAAAAGVPSIHARYGYGLRRADVRPAVGIDSFDALPAALAAIDRNAAVQ
jgi:phosphoglycolate phosphatase-like HAD superfamily hydrolase